MYRRNLLSRVAESVHFSPVTLVNGARQTGKSTFVQTSFVNEKGFEYVNLDELNLLRLAKGDPITFLAHLKAEVAIDEVQRTPELLLPIKRVVDEARQTRRFLLTGSANVLTLPKLSESLAGRMEIHTLWPLSQGELRGRTERFIDFAFSDDDPTTPDRCTPAEYLECLVMGGYPEAVAQMKAGRSAEWFRSYLTTLLQRDVQDISRIDGLAVLPNLLELIAARAGNLINFADLSRMTKLNAVTLKRYYTLLQKVFLVVELPAWGVNLEKRLAKSPKVMINDSGLLCFLRGANRQALERERNMIGGIMENFVAMELTKQIGWSTPACRLLHYRSLRGEEVDAVIEAADKRVVGVEVKASMDVSPSDFRGLASLAGAAGDRFKRGFVLYSGDKVIRYGENLWALPISALWQ